MILILMTDPLSISKTKHDLISIISVIMYISHEGQALFAYVDTCEYIIHSLRRLPSGKIFVAFLYKPWEILQPADW